MKENWTQNWVEKYKKYKKNISRIRRDHKCWPTQHDFPKGLISHLKYSDVVDLAQRVVRLEHEDLLDVSAHTAVDIKVGSAGANLEPIRIKLALLIDDAVSGCDDVVVTDDGTTAGALASYLQGDLVLELAWTSVVATDDAVQLGWKVDRIINLRSFRESKISFGLGDMWSDFHTYEVYVGSQIIIIRRHGIFRKKIIILRSNTFISLKLLLFFEEFQKST